MPSTYTPIASTKITNSSTSIYTFSSIPNTYTDLRLVVKGQTTVQSQDLLIYFNGATTGYSQNFLAMGSNTYATQLNSRGWLYWDYDGVGTVDSVPFQWELDLFNYANTNMFKTGIGRYGGASQTNYMSCVYKSTNAISSIQINPYSGNFQRLTTLSLYGILGA